MEFMCTLELLEGQARVAFQLFNKRFQRSWRYLSDSLGFDSNCALDLNEALPNFQKGQFWKEITKLDTCHKPKNSNLELPTLRFIHRFISATLFPRPETQTIREDELKILFAIVKRQKNSPVKAMIYQWLDVFGHMKGDRMCTYGFSYSHKFGVKY